MKPFSALFPNRRVSRHAILDGLLTALLTGAAVAATTTIGTFTGGDPGEGLDLEGNFLYAVDIGATAPAGKVGDADFLGDNATGVTVVSKAQLSGWSTADYGATANDLNLKKVMTTIRHMWPPPLPPLKVTLAGLEPGAQYKLQLLFVESCCQRGFDVKVAGVLIADDFSPVAVQGGLELQSTVGAVITHEFEATANSLEIVLDGATVTDPTITDLNPILSGLTLERLSAVGDKDSDGLPDDWEQKYFGNLGQKATDDPDQDSLDNATEFANKTDPTKKDTDGDTLTDDAELNTYHTDPTKPDTDSDGIPDAAEINVSHTDPLKSDTDGDAVSDYDELRMITDPLNKDSYPKKTTLSVFTGGDEGEGLDLDGNFLYAINVGPPEALGQIRDAYFTEDTAEGVTISGGNIAGGWHPNVALGDTLNDDLLEQLMTSIRWSNALDPVTPTLRLSFANLEAGAAYKMQLLFAEEAWVRGFDVTIDGRFVVDDFSPMHYQGGFPKTNGVVLTHSFIASSTNVTVILDGRTVTLPEFTDHNPILQGATLELIAPNADSDGDGLPDPWEIDQFNDLSQTATGDPDGDGVRNSEEFAAGTDPRKADTDGDGLSDDAELNTYQTNPLKVDTDGDGLSDAEEVNVLHSNPKSADTDGDGLNDYYETHELLTDPTRPDTDGDTFTDYDELRLMTNPIDPNSRPRTMPISLFTGGDAGEGLDLDGNFLYAINVGSTEPVGLIRDANFTGDNVEGVEVIAGNAAAGWHDPSFGDTENDLLLQTVMSSIRWSDAASLTVPDVTLRFGLLQPGTRYKLQLLFAEHGWPRGFDVFIDGTEFLDDFSPAHYQGGYPPTNGVVVTHSFVATRADLTVLLDGRGVATPEISDHNALLQGATLEDLGPAPVAPRITAISLEAAGVKITLESLAGSTYRLRYKQHLADPGWINVPGAVTATGATTALTDGDPAHRAPPQGYWQVVVE